MSTTVALIAFLPSLAIALGGSEALVRGIDRLGQKLRIQPGLLGILTALGADSPEVSSAVLAAFTGAPDVGVGVALGSNLFNLAALLGLTAIVAGRVQVHRVGLYFDGGMALLATLAAVVLVAHVVSPVLVTTVLVALFVAYSVVMGLRPRHADALPLPTHVSKLVTAAVAALSQESDSYVDGEHVDLDMGSDGSWWPVALIPVALACIVAASSVLVHGSLALAKEWGFPRDLVGTFVLAILTGLPNLYVAVHLARRGESRALVSAALNSNTINVLAGVCLTALVVGIGSPGRAIILDVCWLLAMTIATLVMLARTAGITRAGGGLLIAAYAAFVAVRLFLT